MDLKEGREHGHIAHLEDIALVNIAKSRTTPRQYLKSRLCQALARVFRMQYLHVFDAEPTIGGAWQGRVIGGRS